MILSVNLRLHFYRIGSRLQDFSQHFLVDCFFKKLGHSYPPFSLFLSAYSALLVVK